MLQLTQILGYASEERLAQELHELAHVGKVEYLRLDQANAKRHRLRTTTDHGTDVAIALDRATVLQEGAILYLSTERAIVVRMKDEQWLTIIPQDAAAALELGYVAGNLHWQVRFAQGALQVACEGPEQTYLDRLQPLLSSHRVRRITNA